MRLDPGAFPGATVAQAETAALIATPPNPTPAELAAGLDRGETGAGFIAAPRDRTVNDLGNAGLSPTQPVGAAAFAQRSARRSEQDGRF